VLVDRLALVVVVRVELAIRARDELRGLVDLEALVELCSFSAPATSPLPRYASIRL
jgi:hypothetical protein